MLFSCQLYIGAVTVALPLVTLAFCQKRISFQTHDDGFIFGNLYGTGERGVVLAHNGKFNKESREPQARIPC